MDSGKASIKAVSHPGFLRMVRITDGSCGLCGGTLITSKHVLTAYHCVYSSKKNKLCTGQIIIMGRNNLKDSDIFEDPDCKIKKKKKECKYKKNIRTMEIKSNTPRLSS